MILTKDLTELSSSGITRFCAAVGVFDGVHPGHRKVLSELLRVSKETDAVPVAVTFDPHPRRVISGTGNPPLLIPLQERIRLLGETGVQAVTVIHFTRDFSILSPEAFLDRLLRAGSCTMTGLCVGEDWRFGFKAAGSCELIRQRAQSDLFRFVPVPKIKIGKCMVSSSAIRENIQKGDLDSAAEMLGRRYALTGKVIHGMHLAGPKLGHPTANILVEEGVLPPFGVYAVSVKTEDSGNPMPGVASIGLAPTIRTAATVPRLEVHLFDFNKNLYGSRLSVELVRFIRPEKKFSSIDALKLQIGQDSSAARKILEENVAL